MASDRDPLRHLARAAEELARAASGGLELAITRLEGPTLEQVRIALHNEIERWEALAREDPTAGRVRDLFAALLDVLS